MIRDRSVGPRVRPQVLSGQRGVDPRGPVAVDTDGRGVRGRDASGVRHSLVDRRGLRVGVHYGPPTPTRPSYPRTGRGRVSPSSTRVVVDDRDGRDDDNEIEGGVPSGLRTPSGPMTSVSTVRGAVLRPVTSTGGGGEEEVVTRRPLHP